MVARKFRHSQHHRLSSVERRRSLPVEIVLATLEPLKGLTVIDVGCGKGYFALPFAQAVGTAGKVYAVDTSQEMLALLEVAAAGVENLIAVHSQESSVPLGNGMADVIFTSAVYHELEDRPAMLREMRRLARPAARHVVIDWNRRSAGHGPPLEHRVPEKTVVAEYAALGLKLEQRFQPGPDFFGLTFRESRIDS